MHARTHFLALTLFAGVFLILPHLAHATAIPYWGPIVPGNANCAANLTALIELINNVIAFMLTFILTFFLPLAIAYGGFLYLTSGANPGKRHQANQMILNIVLGVVVSLCAWLIVDLLLSTLTTQGLSGWTSQMFSSGGSPCLPIATAFNQSNGATDLAVNGATNGTLIDCPGNLICSSGKCIADADLENGDGSAGAQCNSTSPKCNSGLSCDATGICSASGAAISAIPASCNAGYTSGTIASSGGPGVYGRCYDLKDGVCSVANLQQTCFGSNAALAGEFCNQESGGNAGASSGSDILADGQSYSAGLFQFNLTNTFPYKVNGVDCSQAFSGQCGGKNPATGQSHVVQSGPNTGHCDQRVVNQPLYDACMAAAKSAAGSIQAACQLTNNGDHDGWGNWKVPSPSGGLVPECLQNTN